ncbi:MAG: PBP1A family penicillin-binding protein [Pseudomonadota bacterium]
MPADKTKSGLKKPKAAPKADARQKRARKSFLNKRPILKWSLIGIATSTTVTLIAGLVYWQSLYDGMPDLPATAELWETGREPAIEFLDANGDTIAIRGPRYGRAVKIDDLPAHVSRAFIAAEDKRFYEHDGADTQAMIRALWSNVTSGRTVSGASTLTQQLVKNLVLSPEQTLKRKAQEIRLARRLEERLSKSEILELYLNRVYFGSGFYGLGAASRFYFDKDPADLTLAEASLLATLPQAPSRLALNNNMQDAKQRQAYVLSEMVDAGFVTPESARIAMESEVALTEPPTANPAFGYILDEATRRASALRPSLPDDLVITLSLDQTLQQAVTDAIDARMSDEAEAVNAGQAAAILIARDGRILALYGGRDYAESQFNRATQAKRQPGSAFKPFVYAAALSSDISPYDVRIDQPTTFGKWSPQNFSRAYMGPVSVQEALRDSLNTVAAQLGNEVGETAIIGLAKRFGITETLRPLPSIALGSQEVTLEELTRAYGPFMTGGTRIDPYLVAKIETSRGDVIYERPDYDLPRVYPRDKAELMTGMMASVVREGTGRAASVQGWPIAGKTGTSQSSRDALFVGYSAVMLGGVWVGNDDDTPMKAVTGGGLPARLWADIMRAAHAGQGPVALPGADALIQLTPDQQARVAYYRDLSMAFGGLAAQ